jgi:hypothetical protein
MLLSVPAAMDPSFTLSELPQCHTVCHRHAQVSLRETSLQHRHLKLYCDP